ncbi:MAG: TonB-dependent receptor [Flavobacteriales bacterium]|jgi:hypothetical protein|nr:TonB-dependent receptor [Flavobacteriales bacterium]MBT3963164.1 TonB-dependent receptor [Flavobacteriales bacterium]MBT4705656.1 TonB-dependent receptor [Flavobacteriales bacterium]MBT4930932.1 TonB-dependent receptor [Flavobacteriales bacterium]MBT5132729.1 TonB-dependent receptor [Flavobacteriales bacterium]
MKSLLTLCLTLSMFIGLAQKDVTLSGYVNENESGEGMIAATVLVKELGVGTSSNEFGFYSISLPPGTYTIEWSFVGFNTVSEQIELTQNITKNVALGFGETILDEVVITGERADVNVTSVEMSVEKMDIQLVKKMPSLMGEADIIRSIQLLPGVTTVGEGATGFNVRGGNVDQNLILLDDSPVFSSSHLFGFFSVFNADAIKSTKLYKGGMPAKYGGRLSSVLDIRQKEGNMKKLEVNGGVGLLFSRLTIQAPIVKNKASFILSGRRSYFDLFFPLAKNETIKDTRLYFYDLNGKVNWIINDKNRIYLAGYNGSDVFNLAQSFSTRWGNTTGSLRWNHLFSDKLFSNSTLVYSKYDYALGAETDAFGFDWLASIENYSAKIDFTYFLNPKNKIDFGWQSTYYIFRPGKATGFFEVQDTVQEFESEIQSIPAVETALYISNEQKIGTRLTIAYGLRWSGFAQVGKGDIYTYDNGPIDPENPTSTISPDDTVQFEAGEIVKAYHGIEPRLSVNYQLNEVSSIKGSYNRNRQYIHLISNTTAATPVDIYMPAGRYIKPGVVDQIGLGYFRNFADNTYESSVEVYYKKFQDLVDYKDEAELLFNNTIETELYSGGGEAYGLEFQFKRSKGKLTGWVSYTLSRVVRDVEEINNGDPYPANWDKTHDVSVVVSYDITESINVSSNFAYMTGRPITYPDGRFTFGEVTAPLYTKRNGARTPDYHRLDLALNFNLSKEGHNVIPLALAGWIWPMIPFYYGWRYTPLKKVVDMDLSVGVYNLYGRKNPYSVYFRQDPDQPAVTKAYQLSIYAIPIPYATLNFKF